MERKDLQQGTPRDEARIQRGLDRLAQLGQHPPTDDPLQGLEDMPELPGTDSQDVCAEYRRNR